MEEKDSQSVKTDASLYNGQPTDTGSQCHSAEVTSSTPSIQKDKKTVDTILYLIKETPNITRKVLAETIGISQSAVQKHINRLKAEHIIIRHGGDRGGYWEILQ